MNQTVIVLDISTEGDFGPQSGDEVLRGCHRASTRLHLHAARHPGRGQRAQLDGTDLFGQEPAGLVHIPVRRRRQ